MMNDHTFDTVIVGGGISGLTAAWHLKKAGVDLCLIEANGRVGGYTRTEHRDGFLLERGPFNIMVRDPSFEALLDEVSSEVNVVSASKAARKRFIYRRGRLYALPTNPISLLLGGLLSPGARLRLIRGMIISTRGGAREETIAEVATRRFGREVANTIIGAAVSGILAGDIAKLSLSACFPSARRVDADASSLIGYRLKTAFGKKKDANKRHKPRYPGLVSFDGGLGALTETLGKRLGDALLSGWEATTLSRSANAFEITCQNGDGEEKLIRGRRVVLASPLTETGALIKPLAPGAGDTLAHIQSASLAVVNLGFRRRDVGHPLDGFGFLVPQDQRGFPLMGALFADSIFPHHTPSGHRLIRTFVGGARDPGAVDRTDDELLSAVCGALRGLLRITGDPVLVDIKRYRGAIPQYHLGHCERIVAFRNAVDAIPGLHIIGNYLEGVSLNDCIRLATRVAGELIQEVAHAPSPPKVKHDIALAG